ncbi:MAG: DUF948 domain-containing protein [Proteobacteria bacterium]|nr:DUF948 domain-containing protein [Pseudomonadota bacterium]MBU1709811.1 DUF948 domain-containing protein [Pseudomonadota bacterium]
MTLVDFLIVITSISLAVVVATLVPALLQINRSARQVEILLEKVNHGIEPLIVSLSETSLELKRLTRSLNEKIDRTDVIIDTVKQSSDTLLLTTNILKNTITPLITQVGGFTAGVRAFLHFFAKAK